MSYNSDKMQIFNFTSRNDLFRQIAEELKIKTEEKSKLNKKFCAAISGGSTPLPFYELLAKEYKEIKWKSVELFWVDERMVPEDHSDSNFGNTKRIMLDYLPIPSSNIHNIRGPNNPVDEVKRYSEEILKTVSLKDNLPSFDLILLGIGDDGHTASLFPDRSLLSDTGTAAISEHPSSGQIRITLTEGVINNADEIIFIVTGTDKKEILNRVSEKDLRLPAARIKPVSGNLRWYFSE